MATVKQKIAKIAIDFIVAYIPYTIVGVIVGALLSVLWWKVCIIVASMIVVNMAFNLLILILSTYRFKVINDWMKSRKK